jgi:hypothetical protein
MRTLFKERCSGAAFFSVRQFFQLAACFLLAGLAGAAAPGMILYDMDQIDGDLRVLGPHGNSHLGRSMASGDINGDGLADLVIGATGYKSDQFQPAVGAVQVIFGSGAYPPEHQIDLFAEPADLTILGRLFGDYLGGSVTVGDLNNDGIDDVIVAGDTSDPGGTLDAGAVYVIFGSDSFPADHVVDLSAVSADMEIHGALAYDLTGYDLAVGDVNGDTIDDLLFSILGYDYLARPDCGAAAVLYGSGSHIPGFVLDLSVDQPDLLLLGANSYDWLGSALAAGDVNGDGTDDLLLSAVFADPLGRDKAGVAALVHGSGSFGSQAVIDLKVTTPAAWLLGGAADDRIGFALECGDLNGDDLDDLVIGAHLTAGTAGVEAGKCHVVYGSATMPPGTIIDFISSTAADINFRGAHAGDKLGYSLACGDFNGDGIDDLMMGAIGLDPPGGEWAGGVFAVYGSDAFGSHLVWDFAGSDPDILIYGDGALEQCGVSVAVAELNGDNLDDCLVGAFQHTTATGGNWCGAAYGIYGCVEAAPPSAPDPASGALNVPLEVTLGWVAGPEAETFDLYFGTVNPPALYQAGLTDPFYDLPATVSGQQYYWRVVAINECSATSSAVWNFTTCIVPAVPGSPDPLNGQTGTALDPLLDWSDSAGADSYTLYFGDSPSPGLYASGITGSQFDLTTVLDQGTAYYWRVEAVNGCGTTVSAEWTFSTCVSTGPPALGYPADGLTGLPVSLTLDWSGTAEADSYNVYFGDTPTPPLYQAGLTVTYLELSGLGEGYAYYWQVEAVNNCGTALSEIRSFVTSWTPVQLLATGPGPDAGNPPLVRIFDPEAIPLVVAEWNAYGVEKFGVNVAAGDLGWDRLDEIVTGAGPGAVFGPHVRGWEPDGTPIPQVNFMAYGTNKWGVNVACGDIDGDQLDEIITGAGPGAVFGPHVRGWNVDGATVVAIPGVSFMAYGTLKYGVNVVCGDIDGDGIDEIVTGAGPGAVFGPHVRGWNVDGGTATAMPQVSFLAYGTNRFGVNVACGDVDGDGIDEIITGAGPGEIFHAHVRGWNFDGASAVESIAGLSWFAYDDLTYGARVGCGDVDGDLIDEILTCPGPGEENLAQIRGWNFDGDVLDLIDTINFPAYENDVVRGGNVTGGTFED